MPKSGPNLANLGPDFGRNLPQMVEVGRKPGAKLGNHLAELGPNLARFRPTCARHRHNTRPTWARRWSQSAINPNWPGFGPHLAERKRNLADVQPLRRIPPCAMHRTSRKITPPHGVYNAQSCASFQNTSDNTMSTDPPRRSRMWIICGGGPNSAHTWGTYLGHTL